MKQQMNTGSRQALLKQFSSLLRTKSKEERLTKADIDPKMAEFLSRKELLFILDLKYKGKFPKDVNLAEMENHELLALIEDGFIILAYFVEQWIQEAVSPPSRSAVEDAKPEVKAKKKPESEKPKDKPESGSKSNAPSKKGGSS
jgi:hypothetical protein